MRTIVRYWLPVVAYVGMVLGGSLLLRPPLGAELLRFDKAIHATEYAILALLAARALRAGRQRPWWLIGGGAVLLAAILGLLDEFLQRLNSARSSDILDALADMAGGLLGATIYLFVTGSKNRKAADPPQAG